MTLNQLISVIEDFALDHAQINYNYFGTEEDLDQDNGFDGAFQWTWVDVSRVDETMVDLNFNVAFMDLLMSGKENLQEVLSDMHNLSMQFLSYIDYTSYEHDYILERSADATPFEQSYESYWAGYTLTFTLRTKMTYDQCQVPHSRTRLLTESGISIITEGDEIIITE